MLRTSIIGKSLKRQMSSAHTKEYKKALARMQEGDKCLVYMKSERRGDDILEPQIVGEYEVASKLFVDTKKIFQSPTDSPFEKFPLRIKLKPLAILEIPILFKPLVPKLNFIKNKRNWAVSIRGKAVIEIPESDYKIISSQR